MSVLNRIIVIWAVILVAWIGYKIGYERGAKAAMEVAVDTVRTELKAQLSKVSGNMFVGPTVHDIQIDNADESHPFLKVCDHLEGKVIEGNGLPSINGVMMCDECWKKAKKEQP